MLEWEYAHYSTIATCNKSENKEHIIGDNADRDAVKLR